MNTIQLKLQICLLFLFFAAVSQAETDTYPNSHKNEYLPIGTSTILIVDRHELDLFMKSRSPLATNIGLPNERSKINDQFQRALNNGARNFWQKEFGIETIITEYDGSQPLATKPTPDDIVLMASQSDANALIIIEHLEVLAEQVFNGKYRSENRAILSNNEGKKIPLYDTVCSVEVTFQVFDASNGQETRAGMTKRSFRRSTDSNDYQNEKELMLPVVERAIDEAIKKFAAEIVGVKEPI